METLINREEVISLAFSPHELILESVITQSDIAEAEHRYLLPVIGEPLALALYAGDYPSLMSEYVAPAVAAWVRYVVQPLLGQRCTPCLTDDGNDFYNATTADNVRLERLQHTLRHKASTLTRRLSDYLNANAEQYPEFDPKHNVLNRCSIDGDIIQTY